MNKQKEMMVNDMLDKYIKDVTMEYCIMYGEVRIHPCYDMWHMDVDMVADLKEMVEQRFRGYNVSKSAVREAFQRVDTDENFIKKMEKFKKYDYWKGLM